MAPDALPPLSKYRLIRPLGAGGMGTVYLAHDTALRRDVAIKFVRADRLGDVKALKRLVREARVAAALDHPAICPVYDIELQPEGQACIVMQYIEGDTLAARLERGPLPVRDVLALALDLAGALGEAHRQGVIHGDLKPQNIMLTADGRPKLLDFGIATLTEAASAGAGGDRTTSTTEAVFAGTPKYMSPEQVTRQPLDGRSDLFSLGCVLYESLTGRPAFEGTGPLDIYSRIVHTHPPPPSSIRPELTPAHDETCRRLLAKNPADRFQSAEQLQGALRVLIPDSTGWTTSTSLSPARRNRTLIAIAAVVALSAGAWWSLTRRQDLPAPPEAAARWYAQGTSAIREGSYHRAKLALSHALEIHRNYPQAYTRLAEAHIELDEVQEANQALLQADLLANPARLRDIDRARNDAIRALLLHDRDKALDAYHRISRMAPGDAGAWLDLGRIQESVGLLADARGSFNKALEIDRSYAAAHLRLGALESLEGRRSEALAEFKEAEELYQAASDVGGETETLLLRGAFLDSLGDVKPARAALERALALARASRNRYHEVRAELRLSAVTATEGRVSESLKEVERAVRSAREAGIDTVAADGLIELGATLTQSRQFEAADAQLSEAIAIAKRQKGESQLLRATVNLASLRQTQGRPTEAIALAQSTLEGFAARRDRRKRLTALAIIARSQEDLEQYPQAAEVARQLLDAASELQDQLHIGFAYESLATQATVFGRLPEALEHRAKAEDIHRKLAHEASLPFDLIHRAELLMRLGRSPEAEAVLRQIDEGAARGIDAYIGRRRRVIVLRALNATIARQVADAGRTAASVTESDRSPLDSTGEMAKALLGFASAESSPRRARAAPLAEPTAGLLMWRREVRYWQLATLLAAGDPGRALIGVRAALQSLGQAPSYELEWRLAALGAIAAQRAGDDTEAVKFRAQAHAALARLRSAWKEQAAEYERRPDLTELRTLARL